MRLPSALLSLCLLTYSSAQAGTLILYNDSSLFTTDESGGNEVEIVNFQSDVGSHSGVRAMTMVGSDIYWTDFNRSGVYKCGLDGSGLERVFDLAETRAPGEGLVYVAPYLYWTDYDDNQVIRATLDGSTIEVIVDMEDPSDNEVGIGNLVVYNNQLYWALSEFDSTSGIYRAELDGSGVTKVHDSGSSFTRNLTEANGRFYWTENFDDVHTSPAGFSDVQDLLDVNSVFGVWYVEMIIAIDNRVLFTANRNIGIADITVDPITDEVSYASSAIDCSDFTTRNLKNLLYTPLEPTPALPTASLLSGELEFTGTLQSTTSLETAFTDMDPQPSSPFEIPAPAESDTIIYYRVRN